MANDSGKNVVVAQQLEALAIAAKNYTLAEIANSGGGSAAIISNFTGASASAAGLSGLVPAPQAGDNDKFLRGDGNWVTLSGGSSATYELPTASTSTKGGIIVGNGLSMNGDTLNVTVSGGSTGGTELVLSNVASAEKGAIWLDSSVAAVSGTETVILPTLPPTPVVNGSVWLVL